MRIAPWLALSALSMGCSEENNPQPTSDAQRSTAVRSCDFEGEITRRTGTGAVTDCGSLTFRDGAQLEQGRQCVLDAQAAHHAFELRVQWQGTDSQLVDVFAGDGTRSAILHDDYDPSVRELQPSANPVARETLSGVLCDGLELDPSCTIGNGTLCLRCKTTLESSVDCTSPSVPGSCHGVGDYEAGKEGSYQPCCAGLREVFHDQQGTDGNGNEVCGHPLLRISSCIEGRCGDGRCEDQERNPCGGCTLDCN